MKNNKNKKVIDTKAIPLDDYERELSEFLEKGEFESSSAEELEKTKAIFKAAAKRHIAKQKSKSITLRLKQGDLIKIKAKAVEQNIPYQTLIGLLIHQYVMGERKIVL